MIPRARLSLACFALVAGCAAKAPIGGPVGSDCAGASQPSSPDGQSVMTCVQGTSGFHWEVSQSPRDVAACKDAPVILIACRHRQRGLACTRSQVQPDGTYLHSDWHPVCTR